MVRLSSSVVADHQHAVAGGDQVELDVVGAEGHGEPEGLERVLGPVAAGPAVRGHRGRHDERDGEPAGGGGETAVLTASADRPEMDRGGIDVNPG